MKKTFSSLLPLVAILFSQVAFSDEPEPKYGPKGSPIATPIGVSHRFVRKHKAPDFWALTGYYLPQMNDHSCSSASVAMVLNALRLKVAKTANDELITEAGLLEKVTTEHWKERVSDAGLGGEHGTSLDQLANILRDALKAYDIPNATVTVVHVSDTSTLTKKTVEADLIQNEKSNRTFIFANFSQQAFTNDPEGKGHISPVGAYDKERKRVLIMETDRKWYEPYWVSLDDFVKGIATMDSGGKSYRGYLIVSAP